MPSYVDGYVLPIARRNLAAYRRMASKMAAIFRAHGALEVRECAGDDLLVSFGATFPETLKLSRGETVLFSWITYKSRAQRDRVNAAVMKDPRCSGCLDSPVFNPRRMAYGGFKVIVAR